MSAVPEGALNLNLLRESYRNELVNMINMFSSPKVIYWEKELLARINQIISYSSLKDCGVINSYLLQSFEDSHSPQCNSVIFILSPKVAVVDLVQSFVTKDLELKQNSNKHYILIAIPRFSFACKSLLKSKNMLSRFSSILEIPLTIVPVEHDVLSMEDSKFFSNYSLPERRYDMYQFVQGLMRFQSVFGLFPKIFAKGEKAIEVAKMLVRMRHETLPRSGKQSTLTEANSRTDLLILIDRSVDPLTPLLQQLNYAGLIDEIWGIQFGVCRPSSLSLATESSKMILNSSDPVYNELRDENFSFVGGILSQKSKEISNIISQSKSAKQLTDLRWVVDQLPGIRTKRSALEIHTSVAEKIQKYVNTDEFMCSLSTQQDFLNGYETDKAHPYIENCLLRGAPLNEVLRLICIQSFCNGGLKRKLLDYYKSELLQVYGFEQLYTLDNLERVGLLYEAGNPQNNSSATNILFQSSQQEKHIKNSMTYGQRPRIGARQTTMAVSNSFNPLLKRNLRLIVPPQSNNQNDSDQSLAKPYSGYVPITTRLIQIWSTEWHPKLYTSFGSPSNAITKAKSALLSGAWLVSNLRAEDNIEMSTLLEGDMEASYSPSQSNKGQRKHQMGTLQTQATQLSNTIPAPEFEEVQKINPNGDELPPLMKDHQGRVGASKPRVVVVAFVGGVTQAEISTLRALSASDDSSNAEYIVITTGTLNPITYIDTLSESIQSVPLAS